MKKNDWILITTVALYSFLFYQQAAGINFVIFNIALIAGLQIKNHSLVKNSKWKIAAIGSLLSSFCIGYYGNTLSVIANIISLSLLSAMSYSNKTSVVVSILFSFYSYFSSAIFMFLDWQERKKREALPPSNSLKKILLIGIPLLITLLFFFMYRASNPLFNDFTKNINLDFIPWSWITFTIGGLILLYGFFYHNKINSLADLDENASNDIDQNVNRTITLFGKKLSINDEEFSGTILFVLLNLLLLIVNSLDINFLFIDRKLPAGINYSQFVHQGTGMLITSILIAIAIILFYFRGALNFSEKSKTIKILAYLWIIQNALMLVSTALRNDMYITEYGLTYKRIGVYFYLILTLTGLLTTFIKIMKAKSNNYLFRINGWLFYGVLVISCFVNWDIMITEFNIHKAKKLEKNYLLNLSDSNLPRLFVLQQDSTSKHKEFSLQEEEQQYINKNDPDPLIPNFEEQLNKRLYYFLSHRENSGWKSWCYNNTRIYKELLYLNDHQKINTLKLSAMGIHSLKSLKEFKNVNEMYLSSNDIRNINELLTFNSLKKLDLSDNKLLHIKGIEVLKDLEYLNISQNLIYDYSPLHMLKDLKELKVGKTITRLQYEILQKNLPNTKIIKG